MAKKKDPVLQTPIEEIAPEVCDDAVAPAVQAKVPDAVHTEQPAIELEAEQGSPPEEPKQPEVSEEAEEPAAAGTPEPSEVPEAPEPPPVKKQAAPKKKAKPPAPEEGEPEQAEAQLQAEDPSRAVPPSKAAAPTKAPPAAPPKKQTPRLEYATPEEEQEWNAIYASLRSRSLLTGTVLGVDKNTFEMTDRASGETERKEIYSIVIVQHRVKIIIPETELWLPGEERPAFVMRNMVGARLDYVILEVDAENSCAIASRRMAMAIRRRYFRTAPRGHVPGKEIVSANILAVGPRRCLVEYSGYDLSLAAGRLSYTSIADLRTQYRSGEELRCLITNYDAENDRLELSAKLATTNPFDGAEQRHPVGSHRQATITGKYNGGVFVTLPDGVTCLCKYSQVLSDGDFCAGNSVIVVIDRYDNDRKLISGRILRKW